MKVKLDKNYRSLYTLEDLDRAKTVIACEKENDENTPKEWAEYAVREALRGEAESLVEVLSAEARTAKNCRIGWDRFCEGSGKFVEYRVEFFHIGSGIKECVDRWEVEEWRYPNLTVTDYMEASDWELSLMDRISGIVVTLFVGDKAVSSACWDANGIEEIPLF